MTYDVQINSEIRRGITYAELISLPIVADTFIRRSNSDWIKASECVELSHIISNNISPDSDIMDNDLSYGSQPDREALETVNNDSADDEDYQTEEHIFIPTAEYFKCKQKRKAAIIGVCTLGIAGLSLMGIGNTWRSNIFAGTSFMSHAGMAFVLKCLSFCFLTALIAIPYFIYSVFALIYYSIRISNLRR